MLHMNLTSQHIMLARASDVNEALTILELSQAWCSNDVYMENSCNNNNKAFQSQTC
uniref:Uncharacterized protein n=1 Tax=Arundo donax TaxID=35708 RepID=A0A0A9DMT1_ARUDO